MLNDGEKGVIIQRDKESYAVVPYLPCGMVTAEQLRVIADVSEKFGVSAMKVTSAGRIALIGIKEEDVDAIWVALKMRPSFAVGQVVRSVKACPGNNYCKRGLQDSLEMGQWLSEKYDGNELPGKMKMAVSGCPNQCPEICIKDIGLVGKKKGWDLYVGGNGGVRPRLAQKIASDLSDDQAKAAVDRIYNFFKENAKPRDRVGKLIERIGLEEFVGAVLDGAGVKPDLQDCSRK